MAFQPILDSSSTSFHFHFILSMRRAISHRLTRSFSVFGSSGGQGSSGTLQGVAPATLSGNNPQYPPQIKLSDQKRKDIKDELTNLSATLVRMLRYYGRLKEYELSSILEVISLTTMILREKADTKNFAYPGQKFVMYDMALDFLDRAAMLVAEIENTNSSSDSNAISNLKTLSFGRIVFMPNIALSTHLKHLHALVYMYHCVGVAINNLLVFGQNVPLVRVQYPLGLSSNLNRGNSSTSTDAKTLSVDFYLVVSNHLNALNHVLLRTLYVNLDTYLFSIFAYSQITTTSPLDVVIKDATAVVNHYKYLASITNEKKAKTTMKRVAIGKGFTTEIHGVEIAAQESGDKTEPRAPHAILESQEEGQQVPAILRSFSRNIVPAIRRRHTNI
ncbi:hypothetical protein H4219_004881 [Mycoemilia scoparia]|uniref:Uncharacterized protein n=1 Tax=Mycoemilia scoparia TaxID=417184 RepID=A0A9W7ZQ34_9FUNG|nr:hypothetical protein H4219_004881 [Mycoemilia scoparia]